MNIAIVTFTYGDNYGQRLQNYALQTALQRYGENVYTLKQIEPCKSLKSKIKTVLKRTIHYAEYKQKKDRHKAFELFDQNYINYYPKAISEHYVSDDIMNTFDYFVAGSDQIWSPYSPDVNSTMFLQFAPAEKRISYAPSFSVETIPLNKEKQYIDYIKSFKNVSIREYNLVAFLQEKTERRVEVVVDPTLLLNDKEWRRIESKPQIILPSKFIVLYFLGSKEEKKMIKDFFQKKDISIIDIMADRTFGCIGPSEFLYLINHAKLVITDSYHGTIFSMIFHTPFIIVERSGGNVNMNSRFETLFKMFAIENRMKSHITSENIYNIDFSVLDDRINSERKKSEKFLDKCFKKNL